MLVLSSWSYIWKDQHFFASVSLFCPFWNLVSKMVWKYKRNGRHSVLILMIKNHDKRTECIISLPCYDKLWALWLCSQKFLAGRVIWGEGSCCHCCSLTPLCTGPLPPQQSHRLAAEGERDPFPLQPACCRKHSWSGRGSFQKMQCWGPSCPSPCLLGHRQGDWEDNGWAAFPGKLRSGQEGSSPVASIPPPSAGR